MKGELEEGVEGGRKERRRRQQEANMRDTFKWVAILAIGSLLAPRSLFSPVLAHETSDYDEMDTAQIDFSVDDGSKLTENGPSSLATTTTTAENLSDKPESASFNHHQQLENVPSSESQAHQSEESSSVTKNYFTRFVELLTEMGYLPGWVPETSSLFVASLRSFQDDFGLKITGVLDEATLAFLGKGRCSYPGIQQHRPFSLKSLYKYRLRGYANKLGAEGTSNVWHKAVAMVSSFTKTVYFTEAREWECPDIQICFVTGPLHIKNVYFSGEQRDGTLAYVDSSWYRNGDKYEVLHYLYVDHEKCWQEADSWRCRHAQFRPSLLVTLVHELGHVLGIEHVKDPASIMFPFSLDDSRLVRSNISKSDEKLFYEHVHAKQILQASHATTTTTPSTSKMSWAVPTSVGDKPSTGLRYSTTAVTELTSGAGGGGRASAEGPPPPPPPKSSESGGGVGGLVSTPLDTNSVNMHFSLCDGRFNSISFLDKFIYIVKNEFVWVLDPTTLELLTTQPTSIRIIWPGFSQPSITCMYRDFNGRVKLFYKKAAFDVSLQKYGKSETAVKFCFQAKNVIIAMKNNQFVKLAQRDRDTDVHEPLAAGRKSRREKDPHSTYTDEMDHIMRNGSVVFFFKGGKMWMNSTFNPTGKLSNAEAMNSIDFWFHKYCKYNAIAVAKLGRLTEQMSAIVDSMFLSKFS